jgi:hypothetical protein
VATRPRAAKLPLERAAEDEAAQRQYVRAIFLAGEQWPTFDATLLRLLQEAYPERPPLPLASYLEAFPGDVETAMRRILEEYLEDHLRVQQVLAEDHGWHRLARQYE